MNSDAMVDVDAIHGRLTAITPGTWWRVGGDIFCSGRPGDAAFSRACAHR